MFSPRYVLAGFTGEEDRILSGKILRVLLDALTSIDLLELQAHKYPPLYTSGVYYHRDPKKPEDWQDYRDLFIAGVGPEDWLDAKELFLRGRGDCKSVACLRAAEYILAGIPAFAQYRWKDIEHGALYHIVVQLPDGTIEDPSKILGMKSLT